MKKPELKDYNLTEEELILYEEQKRNYYDRLDEYCLYIKSIKKTIIWISLIVTFLMLIINIGIGFGEDDGASITLGICVFWDWTVVLYCFQTLDVSRWNVSDNKNREIKAQTMDLNLDNAVENYNKAVRDYEWYLKKCSIDFWNSLDGFEFEKEIAKLYRKQGYDATVTTATADGGVDIILTKNNKRIAVQCKHHAKPIGPNAVRALQGVVASQNYSKGIFVSLNGYTSTVYSEVRNSNVKIELLELKDLLKMAKDFVAPINSPPPPDSQNLANLRIYDFVLHKTFGEGIILAVENGYVTVDFSNFVKKFVFPNAFLDGYLTLKTEDTRVLGEYSFKKYWVFAKHTWNNIKFKNDGDDYSYLIQGLYRIMEIEGVDFKGLVINFESIRPEYYNGGKRFDISEKEGLISSISVFTSFLEFIREARLSVDGFYDFLVKEATDNEIYLVNKQGDNESIFEFIINRKIRLEKVEVEHISSYIMLVQNIMAKEKIDIIKLGKYSVCSNIYDLISKYSTADVPSSETILKWFKMYYEKTIATV
ncbi:MAG: restriction endonuclease [Clostridia bacterium]|nr:restriction endonuclease [Clostridia bacterium]